MKRTKQEIIDCILNLLAKLADYEPAKNENESQSTEMPTIK
ncbi:hypothetical protein [uncultured Ruminococcus sp.]|nr:hypothetical protein [uncultured Ruminococcus sp.]